MISFVRDEQLARAIDAGEQQLWDMIVIGGGATGVGIAVDAASRDYSVLLLEQSDFGKGTSSRSTKLVHGGVRYLKQGNLSLVREALEERAILLRNAPHVAHDLSFIIPCPSWWQAFFYGTGLRLYDWLAGRHNLGKSRKLSRSQVLSHIPTLDSGMCAHGVLYHDGQFDDARLLVNLAQTAARHGGCLVNYAQVQGLEKQAGRVEGVRWQDLETGRQVISRARAVINATGPFCDDVRRMSDSAARPLVAASQGVHVVLPKHFLPGHTAMMVPKTSDGRVVFLIPWHDVVVLGTTDTAIEHATLEPQPQSSEIDFLLETVAGYLPKAPKRSDIQSVFTGVRPLVLSSPGKNTASLSRDHTIDIDAQGLLTITGGKWTTYRRMAEDCVNRAAEHAQLATRACRTRELAISGSTSLDSDRSGSANAGTANSGSVPSGSVRAGHASSHYGSEELAVLELGDSISGGNEPLDKRLKVTPAQILWAVRHEMARTVEDVLARRTRALFINAQAALDVAPVVATWMAKELGRDKSWEADQLAKFTETARCFLPKAI